MPTPSWQVTMYGGGGCAIFRDNGNLVRRVSHKQMAVLLAQCLQTLEANRIWVHLYPIKVTRAEELDVEPEVELDEPEPEQTEDES